MVRVTHMLVSHAEGTGHLMVGTAVPTTEEKQINTQTEKRTDTGRKQAASSRQPALSDEDDDFLPPPLIEKPGRHTPLQQSNASHSPSRVDSTETSKEQNSGRIGHEQVVTYTHKRTHTHTHTT